PPLTPDDKAWRSLGFDLDGRCTSTTTCTDSEGALVKELACKNDLNLPYDGELCRDNAVGSLFGLGAASPLIGGPFGLTEPNWNCALLHGEYSIIFKISGYNGEPDDPEVRLDIYASNGLPSLST